MSSVASPHPLRRGMGHYRRGEVEGAADVLTVGAGTIALASMVKFQIVLKM